MVRKNGDSYNSATGTDPVNNQVNQVQRTFDGLSQLTAETQTHGNSQATGYSVNYAYSFVQGVSEPNNDRLLDVSYSPLWSQDLPTRRSSC
jgi:hypothetical protein